MGGNVSKDKRQVKEEIELEADVDLSVRLLFFLL